MKKLKNEYKDCEDGILSRGYPHRNHHKNKKKKVNLAGNKRRKRSRNAIEMEDSLNRLRAKHGKPPISARKTYVNFQEAERKRLAKQKKKSKYDKTDTKGW